MSRIASGELFQISRLRSVWNVLVGVFRYLMRHGWVPLAALMLAVVGLLGFVALAEEVRGGETGKFDDPVFGVIARFYTRLGPFWQEVGRDLTALGGTTVITLMVSFTALFLLLRRQWRSTAFLVVAVLGGLIISLLLKHFFDRARPDLFEHHSNTMTPGFPSGHSANSAVAYLAVAILLTKLVESVRMKAYILGVGLLIPLLVGLSRIALAVHWPTDVLAGWLIGLAWGLFVYAAATYLQQHGKLEQEGEMAEEQV